MSAALTVRAAAASSAFSVYFAEDYWNMTLQPQNITLSARDLAAWVETSISREFVSTVFWPTEIFDLFDLPERHTAIEQSDLPLGEPYTVLRPIPVKVVRENETEFLADFSEANLAIGGCNFHDAVQALILEILETLDYLSAHASELGPSPQEQLRVLRSYIVKTQR
jgi:hypothetical protein